MNHFRCPSRSPRSGSAHSRARAPRSADGRAPCGRARARSPGAAPRRRSARSCAGSAARTRSPSGWARPPPRARAASRARDRSLSIVGAAASSASVYGMVRRPRTRRRRARARAPPAIQHRDAVGEVAHDAEIVRDEQVADLLARCRSTSRFRIAACTDTSSAEVGSSQRSVGGPGKRARDRDTLLLAAGELAGAHGQGARGRRTDSTRSRARCRPLCPCGGEQRRARSMTAHGVAPVERRVRVLEHDLHVAT